MTDFQPDDVVRHNGTGRTAVLVSPHARYGPAWWVSPTERIGHERWAVGTFTLVGRPELYPLTDVDIDERVAPIWGWVFLLVAVVVLGLVAWFGIYLAGLL